MSLQTKIDKLKQWQALLKSPHPTYRPYNIKNQLARNAYLLNGLNEISFKHLRAMYIRRRKKEHCYSYKIENQTIDY